MNINYDYKVVKIAYMVVSVYPKDLTLSKLKSYAKSLQSWGSPLASGRWYGTFGMR